MGPGFFSSKGRFSRSVIHYDFDVDLFFLNLSQSLGTREGTCEFYF